MCYSCFFFLLFIIICFFSFVNLGIQCVRRKELDASLLRRKKKNIDPFNSRF